jgi:hypothetical protein
MNLYPVPRTGPNSRIIAHIDDSADGDGAPSLLVWAAVSANTSVATVLKVDAISSGRVRFNIANSWGTWRNSPGTYSEAITAGNNGFVAIEFDTFTVADIDLGGSSAII